jgi:CMD domain protein
MTDVPDTDVIDTLAGIPTGSALDAARRQRPEARSHAQASHDLLLLPADPGGFAPAERWAVAAFVAALHNQPEAASYYAGGLAERAPGLAAPVAAAAARGQATGPHGAYPAGPLSKENSPPSAFAADPALGPRLAAALDHAHMLVFHPRDASPDHLQRLVDAGWATPSIVTLSQLVAFLSFQIRAVAGFRAMLAA